VKAPPPLLARYPELEAIAEATSGEPSLFTAAPEPKSDSQ
jgi:hypothetical protein